MPYVLLRDARLASPMSVLLPSLPSNRSFDPNEWRGLRGASELTLILDWKRAIRSLADFAFVSSGSGLLYTT